MTTTAERTASDRLLAVPVVRARSGPRWLTIITTTDHKVIGYMYLVASFGFFLLGGVMALLIRAELFSPGLQVLATKEQYNQLFTMHGTIMLLFFATPTFAGLANAVMPLQIGAPDVAFPRLNALSFWLFLFGGIIATAGFLFPSGPADFGWTGYTPLSTQLGSPGYGANMWIAGLALSGFGTILGAVNFITTIVCMRAPGMTMWRMPIFTWNTLLTSVLVIMAFPVLAAALLALLADRVLGAQLFRGEEYGPILWQHLFWFFGHPEVYILALPFFGVVTEVLPGHTVPGPGRRRRRDRDARCRQRRRRAARRSFTSRVEGSRSPPLPTHFGLQRLPCAWGMFCYPRRRLSAEAAPVAALAASSRHDSRHADS
jgi:cytochrome c oxidase subunit 1